MKKSRVVLLGVALVISSVLIFMGYIGFFAKINIEDKEEGGYTVVGKEFVGEYSKVGKSMLDVDKELKNVGIASTKGFGIYYDDPQKVPSDKCRSLVGDILEEKDLNRIEELKGKGFKVDTITRISSIVAYFPIKSSWSYMIGPMKVYPEFSKYISEKKYKTTKSIEIYDVPNKKIIFIMPYSKQESSYELK
jgi:hypothetical protein